ncbi:MAG: type 1 glutamine amidotransferase [Nitrospirae bacterium]|nr:type 1 glutamine amidotransferase [Nitrospirota bacterium]
MLKNVENEGPGTIEDFLVTNSVPYKVVYLAKEICPDPDDFSALVIMGGPMSVHDTSLYPYLDTEEEVLAGFIEKGKKVLGICLGSQMIAKVLGARVYRGKEPEIGWYRLNATQYGLEDRLIGSLLVPETGEITVFHWHYETFDIPGGAKRLASSPLYPNQAFKYGDDVYAFQFHIEVTKEMICDWMKDEPVDMKSLMANTGEIYAGYLERANEFYRGFFNGLPHFSQ